MFFATTVPIAGAVWLLLGNILIGAAAFFGLRGLYYALFEEAKAPVSVTGTAVGLVSVVGYTPDIFVTFVAGVLIERNPGLEGHQHFFWFMAVFAAIGCLASYALIRPLYPNRKQAASAKMVH